MNLGRAAARRGAWRRTAAFLALPLLCLGLAFAALAHAQSDTASDAPAIPAPVGYVNDHANVYDDTSRAKLESFLDQVQKKTGAQFAVLVMQTTAPETPTEYKTRVFDAWKLGEKGKDNGLLMLVALDEHEVRFETGYGLEGTLPDGLQSRIFREEMAPRFRAGDNAGAITAGVLAVSARIAAEQNVTLTWDGSELRYGGGDDDGMPAPLAKLLSLLVPLLILIIVSSIIRSARHGWGGGWGGWGGGFGGFGGGFGGGGWGGGGGGGSSFGGFGGGSSGGGGGGGKW